MVAWFGLVAWLDGREDQAAEEKAERERETATGSVLCLAEREREREVVGERFYRKEKTAGEGEGSRERGWPRG